MKRFPRLRRLLVWVLLPGLVLIVILWNLENRRGAKEWKEAQANAKEAGISLKRSDYAGPMIPEEENLLKDVLFAEALEDVSAGRLGDWWQLFADPAVEKERPWGSGRRRSRTKSSTRPKPVSAPSTGTVFDYREFFEVASSEEEALSLLSERTRKIDATLDDLADVILEKPAHQIFAMEVAEGELFGSSERFDDIQGLIGCLTSSARFSIRRGDSTRALKLIKAMDRLSRAVVAPEFLDYIRSGAIAQLEMNLVWEGLCLEKWNLDQIEVLDRLLSERDWRAEYVNALKYDASFHLEMLEGYLRANGGTQSYMDGRSHFLSSWLATGGPEGWDDCRRAFITNFFVDLITKVESRAFVDQDQMEKRFEDSTLSPLYYWHYELHMVLRFYDGFERFETVQRIALVALALEKEKLKTGKCPEELRELKNGLDLADPMGGPERELSYQLGPDGRPQIWLTHEQITGGRDGSPKFRWQYWPKKEERPAERRSSRVRSRR